MSRIEAARRKIRVARYAILVSAAAGLAAFAAAARAAHPGAAGSSTVSQAPATPTDDAPGFFGDGSGSTYVTPSYGQAPQVQSGGS